MNSLSTLPEVIRFGGKLADAISRQLSEWGASARVTVEDIKEVTSAAVREDETWWSAAVEGVCLRVSMLFDRQSTFAMCEMAFGGTGTEPPYTVQDRPLSAIEAELRSLVLARLSTDIAKGLSLLFGTTATLTRSPEGAEAEADDTAYLSFRFLITVLGYSGEFTLRIADQQVRDLLAAAAKPASVSVEGSEAFKRRVGEATAKIIVSFPPETRTVRDVMALRTGALLRLAASMTSTVNVSCEGADIFLAHIIPSKDHMTIELIRPA
jgi:flagellar motor switch protein FliM